MADEKHFLPTHISEFLFKVEDILSNGLKAENPADNTITVYEKKDRPSSGTHRTYTIMEFMALLAGHIPSPYESLVYYYGIYSSSHRGKERRENRDDQSIGIQ